MFYIEDVGAHELHGPFLSREKAHTYATLRDIGAYRILTDTQAQNLHEPGSLRLVPVEYR